MWSWHLSSDGAGRSRFAWPDLFLSHFRTSLFLLREPLRYGEEKRPSLGCHGLEFGANLGWDNEGAVAGLPFTSVIL